MKVRRMKIMRMILNMKNNMRMMIMLMSLKVKKVLMQETSESRRIKLLG